MRSPIGGKLWLMTRNGRKRGEKRNVFMCLRGGEGEEGAV